MNWSEAERKAWTAEPTDQDQAGAAFWAKFDEYYYGLGFTADACIKRMRVRHPEIIKALFWSPAELLAWRPKPRPGKRGATDEK